MHLDRTLRVLPAAIFIEDALFMSALEYQLSSGIGRNYFVFVDAVYSNGLPEKAFLCEIIVVRASMTEVMSLVPALAFSYDMRESAKLRLNDMISMQTSIFSLRFLLALLPSSWVGSGLRLGFLGGFC